MPLADILRPTSLHEYIGQTHLVGENAPLKKAIEQQHLFSFILWGPPGVGKTTLARIYAQAMNAKMFEISAVSAGKDDIRKIVAQQGTQKKILFIDEIHRFNKAQQDYLLPFVENGELTVIGATTENPSFEVITPLLSRCRVFILHALTEEELLQIIKRTELSLSDDAKHIALQLSGGDARKLISILEQTNQLYQKITKENLYKTVQANPLSYDKKGEEHFNLISAFIKSMRGGDADAAVYYLARMIEGGEDPLFIARRMVIFASEDIGLAQPTALVVATNVFSAIEKIGLPEGRITLAHGAIYLAKCPKDRRVYNAIGSALQEVQHSGALPVPLHLRNAPTKLMKEIGYGAEYEMYDEKSYLPKNIIHKKFFIDNIDTKTK